MPIGDFLRMEIAPGIIYVSALFHWVLLRNFVF